MRTVTTTIAVTYRDGKSTVVESSMSLTYEELTLSIGDNTLDATRAKLEEDVLTRARVFRCTNCSYIIDRRHMSPCAGICEACEPQGDSPHEEY